MDDEIYWSVMAPSPSAKLGRDKTVRCFPMTYASLFAARAMSEAVEVDSEKRLNRDVALPSHRDRISDGMAMARIRET